MTEPNALTPDEPTDEADMEPGPPASDDASESPDGEVSLGEALALRQLSEQKDKYLRLFAEFENFRKRSVRERQDAELKGMGFLIQGLLDSLDDLGRVAHVDPATTAAQSIVDGVEMVEKKILKSLAGHGLEVLSPVGEVFNPALHEALTAVPAALPEEDERVAQVYQVGYVFHGQLLRPARVVVKQWHG